MDIYIVRKCTVEMKEFKGESGAKYKLPVMTNEDIHSYVFKQVLTSKQREEIQKELEDKYARGGQDEKE
jgi:hypothetical protein